MRAVPVLLVALLLAVCSRPGLARDYETWLQGGAAVRGVSSGNWSGNVAAGFGVVPDYFGAADASVEPLPLIDLEWRGALFASTQRGLGWNVVRGNETLIGPRLTIDWGRKASDSPRLAGTNDVKRSLEAGVFAVRYLGPWRFDGDIRQGLSGGHEGLHTRVGVAHGSRIAPATSIILGASTHFAGKKYSLAYFGANTSGFTDLTATLNFVHEFGRGMYASLGGGTALLLGNAKAASFAKEYSAFGTVLIGRRF